MKRKFFYALAFVAATLVGCETTDSSGDTDTDSNTSTDGTTTAEVLSGEITEDVTLEKNTSFNLSGPYVVKSGATLTIEEGVTITAVHDDEADYILIEQGAKINAVGTSTNPIVMTSESKKAGAWGGLHICGYASTNTGTGSSEIGNATYGGSDDADNSGTLKYIRLEYTGFAFDEEHESNGVSFYGVGNGTEVSYLQAYRGSDDGFEFFGGTVNVKNLVATSCSDDSFDWTDGWRGKAQFLVAYHETEDELGYVCDCLLECDNNGDNNSLTPMSHPIISNVTLVGNNSSTKKDGVMLKAGTEIELYNAIITGKLYPVYTKTTVTENALVANTSILSNVTMTGEVYASQGIYSNELFAADATNSTDYENELTYGFIGTVAGGSAPSDSFFETADYKGAVSSSNDWTQGWTIAPVVEGYSTELTDGGTLTGEITSDLTLAKNTLYSLDGPYIVKAGATLTIEEGVNIVALHDDVADYILIEQGAKINAVGTSTNPIIMTSESEKAGAWGGLHICGYASTNTGTGSSEIGNATYGGSDDADNSGTLKYIRLEYTGFAFDEEHESNGVSFYGVGNGTEVSYLQAYRGSDDGFEFFGGTVNVKNLVATSCSDDSFDWTDGWRGKAQFLVAFHEEEAVLGYVCDCLLECDNNGDNNSLTPMSHPIISNVTLVGNNSSTKKDGVMLKAGTEIELYNAIITGKTYPIYTKSTVTENALYLGTSILSNITMSDVLYANESIYSNALFLGDATNSVDYVDALTDDYVGIVEGGSTPADDFFETADYKGAVKPGSNWTYGWTL